MEVEPAGNSETVQKPNSLNDLSIGCGVPQNKKAPPQNPETPNTAIKGQENPDKVVKVELASGAASKVADSERASSVPAEKASKPKAAGPSSMRMKKEMVLGESPSIAAIDLRDQLAQELVKIAVEKLSNESGTFIEPIKFEYFQKKIKSRRPDLADFGSRYLGVDMTERNFGKSELHLALGTGVFSRRGESSRLIRVAPMKYTVGAEVEVYTIDHSIPGRFRARILQSITDDQYEIEYLDFKDGDSDTSAKKGQNKVPLLKEIVSVQRIRPKPPRSIRRFPAGRPCEAEWEDGWYEGNVLEEINMEGKYKVRFCESQAELLLPQKKVRDLVDWIEAEGKWVTAQRWDRKIVKSTTDSAKKRKSKQSSKKQNTSTPNANSKNEDKIHSDSTEHSKTASMSKAKRSSSTSGKEIGEGHKNETKNNEKKSNEKNKDEENQDKKNQDEIKSIEKKSIEKKSNVKKPVEKKSNDKKANDKNQNNKKLNEKKPDEKKKVTPPKLGGGSGILAPYFKNVPDMADGNTDDASRKPNFSSESEAESNLPKSQAPNKKSKSHAEDSAIEFSLKSNEPKANPNSKTGKGRTDTKNRIETVKNPSVTRPSPQQKEKRGHENRASVAGEQKAHTKEQRESSKKKATETEVQPSTRGAKRQRLSTSGTNGSSHQGRLEKKDQPSEKQLPTRASKKQKLDLPSTTGEIRGTSKSRSSTQHPQLTSTPKRDGVESSKSKTKDLKKRAEAKLEEGRTKTGLELYKQGATAIGTYIRVFWDGENSWFSGKIVGYSQKTKKHKVIYDDGDTCEENLAHSKVELV